MFRSLFVFFMFVFFVSSRLFLWAYFSETPQNHPADVCFGWCSSTFSRIPLCLSGAMTPLIYVPGIVQVCICAYSSTSHTYGVLPCSRTHSACGFVGLFGCFFLSSSLLCFLLSQFCSHDFSCLFIVRACVCVCAFGACVCTNLSCVFTCI
jgi:hypothetical protein